MSRRLMSAAVAAAILTAAVPVRGATLDYRGLVLPSRDVRALAAEALRAPGDSLARGRLLRTMTARLQNLGYLRARVTASVDTAGEKVLRIAADEGVRYRIGSVRLDVPGAADSLALAGALALAEGAPASPGALTRAVERGVAAAVAAGFAYARLGVSGWEIHGDRVAVAINGDLGPRVRLTGIEVQGLGVTRQSLVERAVGPVAGRVFDPALAEAGRERLEQLGLFSRVEYAGLAGGRDRREARLRYVVSEPGYNTFDGVVGFQGEAGVVGRAALELGNLLGTGRRIGLGWESRGAGLSDLNAYFVEPLVLGLPLSVRAGIEHQVQDTIFVRTRWGVRAEYAVTPIERIEAGYEIERAVQGAGEVQEASSQYTVFAIERNAMDRRIGARRGTRVRIEGAGIFKRERLRPPDTRKATAGAVAMEGEWHRPLGARSGLTLEWHAAGRFSSQRVLAAFERYPLGGAASLRGFDEEAFRVDRFALTRLEWRWFLGDGAPRVFVFWDHASMATREAEPDGGDHLEVRHADGIGAGLRIEAAGGIVGIDYGLAAGRAPLDGKIHLRLLSTF